MREPASARGRQSRVELGRRIGLSLEVDDVQAFELLAHGIGELAQTRGERRYARRLSERHELHGTP